MNDLLASGSLEWNSREEDENRRRRKKKLVK